MAAPSLFLAPAVIWHRYGPGTISVIFSSFDSRFLFLLRETPKFVRKIVERQLKIRKQRQNDIAYLKTCYLRLLHFTKEDKH